MDDWTPEMDEAFNEIEKQSNRSKQILKEIKPQREWIGLTDEEISAIDWKSNETLHDFAKAVEAKLKELNHD